MQKNSVQDAQQSIQPHQIQQQQIKQIQIQHQNQQETTTHLIQLPPQVPNTSINNINRQQGQPPQQLIVRSPQQIQQQGMISQAQLIQNFVQSNQMNPLNRIQHIILPPHQQRQDLGGQPKIVRTMMFPDKIFLKAVSRNEDLQPPQQHLSPNNEVFRGATVTSTTTTGQE